MPVLERAALEASPLADLHAIASELGLDGYRRLRKEALIDAITGAGPAPEEPPAEEAEAAEPEDEAGPDEPGRDEPAPTMSRRGAAAPPSRPARRSRPAGTSRGR